MGTVQRNKGKQQNGKDQRSLQENWRYQGNILCNNGHDKNRNSKGLVEAKKVKKK